MTSLEYSESSGGPCLVFGDGKPFGHEFVEQADQSDWLSLHGRHILQEYKRGLMALRRPNATSRFRIDLINSNFLAEHDSTHEAIRWQPNTPAIVDHVLHMSPANFADFCRKNVAFAPVRQEDLDGHKSVLDEAVLMGVDKLEQDGVIVRQVADKYRQTVEKTKKFTVSDAFDAGGMLAEAYCDRDGNISLAKPRPTVLTAGLSECSGWKSDRAKAVALHEYTHALGARFERGLTSSGARYPILEEVVASYIPAVALKGQTPSTVGPGLDIDYVQERSLVALLMTHSSQPVEPPVLLDAFFEAGKEKQRAINIVCSGLDRAVEELLPEYESWAAVEVAMRGMQLIARVKKLEHMRKSVLGKLSLPDDEFVETIIPSEKAAASFYTVEVNR